MVVWQSWGAGVVEEVVSVRWAGTGRRVRGDGGVSEPAHSCCQSLTKKKKTSALGGRSYFCPGRGSGGVLGGGGGGVTGGGWGGGGCRGRLH